jgi:hypothetical protein
MAMPAFQARIADAMQLHLNFGNLYYGWRRYGFNIYCRSSIWSHNEVPRIISAIFIFDLKLSVPESLAWNYRR